MLLGTCAAAVSPTIFPSTTKFAERDFRGACVLFRAERASMPFFTQGIFLM